MPLNLVRKVTVALEHDEARRAFAQPLMVAERRFVLIKAYH